MSPKVSIIVPNYNHKPYLKQRLDSVFNQTVQDFEVILLDDASTDGSQELLKTYQNHPKVSHLIVNDQNSGSPFKQWQKGIELAQGEYIWIAESDDVNDLRFIETYLLAGKANTKLGMFSSGINIFGEGQNEIYSPFRKGNHQGAKVIREGMLKTNSFRNGSSILFLKKALNGMALEKLNSFRICGDWWLWVNILRHTDLYFVNDVMTSYRKHNQATTYNLAENPEYFKEISIILKEVFSWKLVSKDSVIHAIKFWESKIKKANINNREKEKLIKRFHRLLSVIDRFKLFYKSIKSFFKKKVLKLYGYAKKQYHTKFGLDNDLILIYTLSKVGSSSVYHSLKKQFPYKEIHHIHFLGDTWLNKFKNDHQVFQNNLNNAERMFQLLQKRQWKIKIISLTRDPVARDISGIFQTWQHVFDVSSISQVPAEDIISFLSNSDFKYSENWFETDFLEFTGLNVFNEKFDSKIGFQVYKTKKASILIMQLEQLNHIYNDALNVFMGKGNYVLQNENITALRMSGVLNKKVKTHLRLPLEKINTIYSSKYSTTFYSESQIQKFKKKWKKQ